MKALGNEKDRIYDIGLIAQATVATLVLVLAVTVFAFSGLVAAGLVQLG